MDVIDFNYGGGGDLIGSIKFAKPDEKSANHPGDPSQISKVYVDQIQDSGNASDFTITSLISQGLNFNSQMGDEDSYDDLNVVAAEARQLDLKGDNMSGDKVVVAVSEEETFEQKVVAVEIKVDCTITEPANLFVQLPSVREKVHPVVTSDVCGQDEGKLISDELNGNFGVLCNDGTTKLRENEDKIVLIPKSRGRDNQTEKEGEYYLSDLVWGKVRSHPWWPGQILEPSSASDKVMKYFKKDSYLIAYFGDQTFAWNNASQILPFGLHFQEMEKQSREETFKIAVDAALDEVSRRVECGMVCGCLPETVLDRVKSHAVSSAGIQVQRSRIYYGGNGFPAAASFVPAEIDAYLKSLAETPNAAVNTFQFTAVRAQLWAFIRWRGCSQFPAVEKFTGSMENDANPMALHEEELFDAVLLEAPLALNKDDTVAVERTTSAKETSYKRKHLTAEGQRRKKQRVLETMPDESSYQEEFNWDMTLASSVKKKRRANVEISLEKVREGHLLPTANNVAASIPRNRVDVGELRRLTGKSKRNSSSKSSSKRRRQGITPQECPPVDEMLSKMVIVAENPLETCSLLKSVAGFFVKFRNSICLENNNMVRKEGSTDMFDVEHGSELVTGEAFKLKGTGEKQTDKDTKQEGVEGMKQQKAEGMIENKLEEARILEDDEGIVVAEAQGGFDNANVNKDGVAAMVVTSDGDGDSKAMVVTGDAGQNFIDEKSEEYSPTLLILNFNNLESIPSIKKLNSIFNSYGPLNELDTEILRKSKRAKIVFKRRSDAENAFSSAGKYRVFGPSLISYRLKYSAKTYNAKRRKKKKAGEAEAQSGER